VSGKLITLNGKLSTVSSKLVSGRTVRSMTTRIIARPVTWRIDWQCKKRNARVKDQGTINMAGNIAKSEMNQQTLAVKAANRRHEASEKSNRMTERAGIIANSSNGIYFQNGFLIRVGSFCFSPVDDSVELV
jgi:hypothetical protein